MENEKIYIAKGDESALFYKDSKLTNRTVYMLSVSSIIREFTRASWIGEGGDLGEQHGEFLSKISAVENSIGLSLVGMNSLFLKSIEKGEGDTPHYPMFSFFDQIVNCYVDVILGKKKNKKILETIELHTSRLIYKFFTSFTEVIEIEEEKTGEVVESLSLLGSLKDGKLAIIGGEIMEGFDILAQERTGKSCIIPRRLKETYHASLTDEIKALSKRNKTLFTNLAKSDNRMPHLAPYLEEVDETFLLNREEYVDWIKMFAHPGFSITLLSGDSGVGKSELVQQVCARMNMPLVRIDFSGEIIAEQILWSQNFNPETKKMEVVEGIVPFCLRNGIKLCLEEFSSIPPSVAFELHRLFEKGHLYIKDNDTLIKPHPQFSVVLTDNRIGNPNFQKYFGTQQQNAALISRINDCVWIPYPPKKLERDYLALKFPDVEQLVVINEHSHENQNLLNTIVDFANDIRPKYERGELGFTISPRDIVSFFKSYYKLEDLQKSFEYSILNFNRGFKTDEDAVRELFNKYFGKNPQVKNEALVPKVAVIDVFKKMGIEETPVAESSVV